MNAMIVRVRAALSAHPLRADVALALAGLAFACYSVFGGGDVVHGSRAVHAAYVVALATLVVFRRRAPFAVFLAGLAAVLVDAFATQPMKNHGGLFLAVLFAYSLGAYASVRKILVGASIGFVVLVVEETRMPGVTVAGAAFDAAFLFTAIALGRLVAIWRGRATVLERLNESLARERELSAQLAVAAERTRIARDLHDVLAHSIGLMVIQAEAAEALLDTSPARTADAIAIVTTTGRTALAEMRDLVGILRDDTGTPEPQPGLQQLPELVARVRSAGLPVSLNVVGQPVPLAPGVDLSAYRIVQEALTNALKHAGRAHARVVVRYGDAALELEVTDDGDGTGRGGGSGQGLIGMRERAALYGGELATGRRPGGGYVVRARLPFAVPAA